MEDRGPLGVFPALFIEIFDMFEGRLTKITVFCAVSGFGIQVLSQFFGVRFSPYGTAFEELITSDWFISSFVLIIFMTQIIMFQKIAELEKEPDESRLEDEETGSEEEVSDDIPEKVTDGGKSTDQPRDSKGRFKSADRGGSNILLLAVAGMTGYLIASQSGNIEPLAGALFAIALMAFYQSN